VTKNPVVILGAGCAGLAAGRRLREKGVPIVMLELEDHVGGLAGGVRLGGDIYEYGPHIFHTTDAKILADVIALMGSDLLPYERTIQIKFLGNYFQFPLSIKDVLFKLPLTTVAHAALSFMWHFAKGAVMRPESENSETILRRYYGDVLYKIFSRITSNASGACRRPSSRRLSPRSASRASIFWSCSTKRRRASRGLFPAMKN
jgi:protoporphyrinogen oxidase